MNDVVSVIIPVYNPGVVLHKCIQSVLAQSYTKIEIILVDDGSTDGASAVCDDYAKKDSRVKVIHQENAGVSVARNNGILSAMGKYLTFVDSDDWLSDNAIAMLIDEMKSSHENIELVIGEIKTIDCFSLRSNRKKVNRLINMSNPSDVIELLQNVHFGPYAKLYLTSKVKDNRITFPEGVKYGEDSIFIYRYLKNCSNVKCVGEIVYFYNKLLETNASKKKYRDINKWSVIWIDEIVQLFVKKDMDIQAIHYLQNYIFSNIQYFHYCSGGNLQIISENKKLYGELLEKHNFLKDGNFETNSLFSMSEEAIWKSVQSLSTIYRINPIKQTARQFFRKIKRFFFIKKINNQHIKN